MSLADDIRDEMDKRGLYGGQKIDTLLSELDGDGDEFGEDKDEDEDEDE